MNPTTLFANEALKTKELSKAINLYKKAAASDPGGYLNTPIFQRMRDGRNDKQVKRFFAGPFSEVRLWLPEMLGIYISRFFDHPLTFVVVDNLSDEYGKYLGYDHFDPSHAELYRRVLDELKVKVEPRTMSTPFRGSTSLAARKFYDWFKDKTTTETPTYLLGHFLAYEITDVLDFPEYLIAAERMWPGKVEIHEFFDQHVRSEHDRSFAEYLQPVFSKSKKTIVAAMCMLLERWTQFYREASQEI